MYLLYVSVHFACMCVCVLCVCLVPVEVRRRHQLLWYWSYRWSELGTKLRFSARATGLWIVEPSFQPRCCTSEGD